MMNMMQVKVGLAATTLLSSTLISGGALAQNADAEAAGDADQRGSVITVLGTRVEGRTADESTAPVDNFSSEALSENGFTQLGEALQTIAPSFNFSRTQISDGSDLFRPATLRGLQPDQTLVLVNGKRRHNQTRLGNQGTVGGGAAGTDMNAIPLLALKNVQVLRDGAAAQYGSDAIAGVINLQLKDGVGETSGFVQYGETYEGDGGLLTMAANTGFAVGEGGFVNITGEYREGDTTNRSDPGRPQADGNPAQWRIGDADTEFMSFFVNAGLPIGDSSELYAFGGYSKREALGAGFYRDFDNAQRNVPQVFPNGFLPRIGNTAKDVSIAVGMRTELSDTWSADVSAVYGDNAYSFDSFNTINASIAADYLARNPGATDTEIAANSGPNEGFSGKLGFDQLTFNADFSGEVDLGWANPVNVAFGAEYRRESYQIVPGSLESYSCGIDDNPPFGILSVIDGVTPAACGFQAFPGFRPESATDVSRSSFALYVDVESELSDSFILGLAGRFEDFEGVGSNVSGKIVARWDPSDVIGLRGSVSTGFRAPSLQQSGFTAVTTNIGASGALEQSFTAPAGSAFPASLGINGLDFETSLNLGAGVVIRPSSNFTLAIDAYQIEIKDRIVQSGGINAETLAGLPDALAAFNDLMVQQAFFFTNAVDSNTRGIDIVATYQTALGAGDLNLSASANINKTEIDSITPPEGIPAAVIFDNVESSILTGGQPRFRGTLTADYKLDRFSLLLRANYFGKTEVDYFARNHIDIPGTQPTSIVESAVLVDLEVAYDLTNNISVAIGGNNIFDQTPDELASDEVLDIITGGAARYPLRAVPYGFNGGQYYARINFTF